MKLFVHSDEIKKLNLKASSLNILKLNNNYTIKEVKHKEKEAFVNGLKNTIAIWFAG